LPARSAGDALASLTKRDLFAVCGAFVLALALFGLFVPRLYTADDLQYASVVDTAVTGAIVYHPAGGPPFPAPRLRPRIVVNPRYALDWPTSIGAVRLARALGWHDEVGAIITTRVLAGAAAVALFFASLLLLVKLPIAAVVAALLACSLVFWTYSTHMDETMGMVAFTCAALFFLSRRFVAGHSRRDVLVPALLGVASLYNFTAAVTALAATYAFATTGRSPLREAARFAAAYIATAFVGVLASIAAAGDASHIVRGSYWKSNLFVGHPEYGFHPLSDAFSVGADFVRAIAAYPPVNGTTTLRHYFDTAAWGARAGALAFYGLVAALALAPLVVLIRRRAVLDGLRRPVAFALVWLAFALVFAWWWDPTYIKYFVLPVLSWSLLLALALAALARRDSPWFPRAMALCAAGVGALFLLNLSTIFWPQSRDRNEWHAAADVLRASPRNALFVSAGKHPLDFYIAYFARRDVVSFGLARYAANGAKATGVVRQHVREHTRAGGPVYVYGLRSVPRQTRRQVLALLPGKLGRPVWRFGGVTVYRAG
jgi:hypothetical protein